MKDLVFNSSALRISPSICMTDSSIIDSWRKVTNMRLWSTATALTPSPLYGIAVQPTIVKAVHAPAALQFDNTPVQRNDGHALGVDFHHEALLFCWCEKQPQMSCMKNEGTIMFLSYRVMNLYIPSMSPTRTRTPAGCTSRMQQLEGLAIPVTVAKATKPRSSV